MLFRSAGAGREKWDAAKRFYSFIVGVLLLTLSIISIKHTWDSDWEAFTAIVFFWALSMFLFGVLVILLQLGDRFEGAIVRFASFLDLCIGRGFFYLFTGT